MLRFQPFTRKMERFAAEIIPRVRALTLDSEAIAKTTSVQSLPLGALAVESKSYWYSN